MTIKIKKLATYSVLLMAAGIQLLSAARDGATRSAPTATAPSSGAARASGGFSNGMDDPKSNHAALNNGAQRLGQRGMARSDAVGSPMASAHAGSGGGSEQSTQVITLSRSDQLAMRSLAQAHLYEAKLAGLATATSTDAHVRAYAIKMLEDHLSALDSLRGIADQGTVILPGGVESTQAASLHGLALKTGRDFDLAYLAEATATLPQQELRFADSLAKSAQSERLKRHAADEVTRAGKHLALAQQITGSAQVATNALDAARTAGQSVSASAPVGTSSNRTGGNGGNAGASSVAGSAVHPEPHQGHR